MGKTYKDDRKWRRKQNEEDTPRRKPRRYEDPEDWDEDDLDYEDEGFFDFDDE